MRTGTPVAGLDGTPELVGLPSGLPFLGEAVPACAHPDTRVGFELAGDLHGATAMVERAIEICQGCPYLTPCREWALEHAERWGVWGGMSRAQRGREIQRRRRKRYHRALHGGGSESIELVELTDLTDDAQQGARDVIA